MPRSKCKIGKGSFGTLCTVVGAGVVEQKMEEEKHKKHERLRAKEIELFIYNFISMFPSTGEKKVSRRRLCVCCGRCKEPAADDAGLERQQNYY